MPDLLLEFLSEEIPARMQADAAENLRRLVTEGLVEAGLTYASAGAFATPRRLVLSVEGLSGESPTTSEIRRGPREDAPAQALEGFLRSTGLTQDALSLRDEKKGRFWIAEITHPGRNAGQIIAELIPAIARSFPWPKSMRWGTGRMRWVRPLQSVLCLLSDEAGADVVAFDLQGLPSGAQTRGHRFHAPEPFSVSSFEDYAEKLQKHFVILSAEERAQKIWHDAEQLAFASGLELVPDPALLAEVAGLVEWPVVLMGEIGAAFLDLPSEVLQTSMREHQKFFSVRNPATGRIERFVTVANRETADGGATILAGNAKVLSARLSDAKFFWENDLRVASGDMRKWLQSLDNVTFQAQLGSQGDRLRRIGALARNLASALGVSPADAANAARLSKADLASEMVHEFPELQGVMGRYYAEAAGHPPEIAAVAEDHYAPLGPSDAVPTAPLSVVVALADKLDMLTGFWAIDEKPTGSKDPFALRRAALGVIRIVLDNDLRLGLDRLIDLQLVRHKARIVTPIDEGEVAALVDEIADHGVFGAAFRTVREALGSSPSEGFMSLEAQVPDKSVDLLAFIHDRLKVHLRAEGLRHDVIDAVLSLPDSDDLALVVARAHALQGFLDTEAGENLVQAYRRAANILAQAEARDGVEYRYGADAKFAETEAERDLFAALGTAREAASAARARGDFAAALSAMAELRGPIDGFFDTVQVNAENEIIRRNRLNMLHEITDICASVADLSRVEG